MNRLKSIVAGIDFSDCSRSALQQAVRVALWNKARLHVVHVIECLVITTKGRTNLRYVLLGSTVERLLREISCSVLTVKRGTEGVRVPLKKGD